ncbi:hypothetical protein BP5796_10940 [Coleophoma crateriformis]|uniref:F-box domain-containing protein n=1 Tax=Coleophoma crateriformis TaxID=565419 RepID=A0A3D8QLQ5_9HELO|nr:hypothetical protein BP5796_10940 [Coleophoma crateriformis]
MPSILDVPAKGFSIFSKKRVSVKQFFRCDIREMTDTIFADVRLGKSKYRYSKEATHAAALGDHASALRRLAKRREAFATAEPFTVAIIGFADAYLYCNGLLSYILEDTVRILDVHNTSNTEVVIKLSELLRHELPETEHSNRGRFKVLYHADNIIACLYISNGIDETAYLAAFDLKLGTVKFVKELDSTEKIFVRHNAYFLYVGTHSELGTDGYKKWVIRGYEFESCSWFDYKIYLPDLVGSEIGQTVCFEIHEGFFYALSNQTSFEVEEIDWTSFYHCARFPLDSPCLALLEITEDENMWRRQHQEGPIDDRWTSLSMHVDECTGELMIIECRKEWRHGSSKSQRTCYTTPIKFLKEEEEDCAECSNLSSQSTSDPFSQSPISSQDPSAYRGMETKRLDFPDERLALLIDKDDNSHYIYPPARLPQRTHPIDDGPSMPTLARSCVRYYDTATSTFLDLIDDPPQTSPYIKQRITLRAGTRNPKGVLRHEAPIPEHGILRHASDYLPTALEELYDHRPITSWPNEDSQARQGISTEELNNILNPPTFLGNIEGTADERSVIYITGGGSKSRGLKAIVLISFDPALKLVGLKTWSNGVQSSKGVGEGPHIDGRATGSYVEDAETSPDHKGKGKQKAWAVSAGEVLQQPEQVTCSWLATEKAMYQDVNMAYWLGT